MRVLHLLPDLAVGGGQTVVLNHAREFDRTLFDVAVAHLRDPAELAPAFENVGVETTCLHHTPGHWPRTVLRLVRLVRRMRPDILHLHTGTDRLYGLAAAAVTRTPVVYHLHGRHIHLAPREPGAGLRRRTLRRLEAPLFERLERRLVRRYVATSEDIRALFRPLVSAPISVLSQSIPRHDDTTGQDHRFEVRRLLGIDPDTPVLINVSRLVAGKGHCDLIRMLDLLPDRSGRATLVLVGDGPLRDLIAREAREAGLDPRVRFLGNRQDVPALLAAADVFVFPSRSEGFGLAVLEAMAARLPVVAYRLPSLTEFVEQDRTALLVDVGDVEALARHVDRLLHDRELAAQLGAAGRRTVEARFPADATARSLESVYAAVACRQPPQIDVRT